MKAKPRKSLYITFILGTVMATACNHGGGGGGTSSNSSSSSSSSTPPDAHSPAGQSFVGSLISSSTGTDSAVITPIANGDGTLLDPATGTLYLNLGGGIFYNTQTSAEYSVPGAYSVGGEVKDVLLQRNQKEKMSAKQRAEFVANNFHMKFESAVQLVQLADTVKRMGNAGHAMTPDDRQAVTKSALKIAGIKLTEVNDAMARSLKGDDSMSEKLIAKAAQNLGMPSAAALRDQLVPALGIDLESDHPGYQE